MPGGDFCALVDQLLRKPGTAVRRELLGPEWGHHEENTARLLEAIDHLIRMEWTDRITDPEDPEVKRARAEAKRSGHRPPPRPVLEPAALRPPEYARQREEAWLADLAAATEPATPQVGERRRYVSLTEFDALIS
jgi:hypothetical protein